MYPAIRGQADALDQEYHSEQSATSFIGTVDLARQEDKDGADINQLIARYGGFASLARVAIPDAEIDYTVDLQDALSAISDAKHAWRRLPTHLREKYSNWQQLLAAIESGELKELTPPTPEPPGAVPPPNP